MSQPRTRPELARRFAPNLPARDDARWTLFPLDDGTWCVLRGGQLVATLAAQSPEARRAERLYMKWIGRLRLN